MVDVFQASSERDLAEMRALFVEYWRTLVLSPGFPAFEEEVTGLPDIYGPPGGRLILARSERRAAGCVALRPLSTECCEVKRLYVRPRYREIGLERILIRRALVEARRIGYTRALLDVRPSSAAALAFYESLGFVDLVPFRFNPVPGTRYLVHEFDEEGDLPEPWPGKTAALPGLFFVLSA